VIVAQRLSDEDPRACARLQEPTQWLEQYGDELFRFALARLRRPHDAEDAVQETLLAAFKTRSQFAGRAQPRTWLLAILRSKILDRLRVQMRQAAPTDPSELDAWFDASGHWRQAPQRWDDPATLAERAEFWNVLRNCLARLPAPMAAAFTLRTIDEQRGDDVCRELAISPANLWVLLHRARLRLVRCLESKWFNGKSAS
jgi:RNA polymerase sigma-70 factor (ECF subfamily)